MAKRVDYQDPNGDLAEVHERRNAEIRAWADARIAASNAHLTGDHVTTVDDWDLAPEPTEPQEQPQPVDNSVDNGTAADDTVAQADEDEKAAADAVTEPEKDEKPAPAKKAPAKKAAAEPKEAPSKE